MLKSKIKNYIVLFQISIFSLNAHAQSENSLKFKHPGIVLDKNQLEFTKNQIKNGITPWVIWYKYLTESKTFEPMPFDKVECGLYSKPNIGCNFEIRDAKAALTNALLYSYSGKQEYALTAIKIMNAWSYKLTGGHTNANAPLQASWAGAIWPRVGEIIKNTASTLWNEKDIIQFKKMLETQYLPNIKSMYAKLNYPSNWYLASIEAQLNIAVFLDDYQLFNEMLNKWRHEIKATIYLQKDGALPIRSNYFYKNEDKRIQEKDLIRYWFNQSPIVEGQSQEMCRDLEHAAYGFASLINVAETAYIQGVDLYEEEKDRLIAGMEFHSKYQNNTNIPTWLCKGKLTKNMNGTLEIGYNHYANKLKMDLPETKKFIFNQNIKGHKGHFHSFYERLTHTIHWN